MPIIEERKVVWSALSELYLDTELQPADLDRIAEIFKQSGFSFEEIKAIDCYEVAPVLRSNLYSVAGEWTGFKEDWLFDECKKNCAKKRSSIKRLKYRLQPKPYWAELEKRFS